MPVLVPDEYLKRMLIWLSIFLRNKTNKSHVTYTNKKLKKATQADLRFSNLFPVKNFDFGDVPPLNKVADDP